MNRTISENRIRETMLLIIFCLIMSLSGCAAEPETEAEVTENQDRPVIAVAWHNNQESYSFVSTLKAIGINCLASTTIRNTVMTPDGKKLSDFGFVQFREY